MAESLRGLVQRCLHVRESCSMAVSACAAGDRATAVLALVTSRSAREGERALFVFELARQQQEEEMELRRVVPLSSNRVLLAELSNNESTGAPQLALRTTADAVPTVYEAAESPSSNATTAKMLFAIVKQCALRPLPVPPAQPTPTRREQDQPFGWLQRYTPTAATTTATTATTTMTTMTTMTTTGPTPPMRMTRLFEKPQKAEIQTMTVFFGTWNVNGQQPPPNLDAWLVVEGALGKPDIYCIGFQELDLRASALVLGDTSRAGPWEHCIAATLAKCSDYVLLATKQLVGILLCVFARRAVAACISDVQSDIMPVGILGVMGNKGGVAVRFNINDSTFCVVNSHLNAHTENVARRNQDYNDIARELVFFRQGRRITIWDHDYLFWIGDLNYRISAPDAEVRARIARGDYAALLQHDQLRVQQHQQRAFSPFREAPIAFAPTYKYDHNSTSYDTSAQARCPAWCDRVLWREPDRAAGADACCSVSCLSYARHELLTSDHRPVSAVFAIHTRLSESTAQRLLALPTSLLTVSSNSRSSISSGRRQQVCSLPATARHNHQHHQQQQQQDRLRQPSSARARCESPSAPETAALAFSATELDFGVVGFMEQQVRKLILRNTGTATARWHLQQQQQQQQPEWFQVVPTSGALEPGAQAAILVVACVDRSTAHRLVERSSSTSGTVPLAHKLVVRLVGAAQAYEVALAADYACSCFGLTLEQLVRARGPVRTAAVGSQRVRWVPAELWRLVDELCSTPERLGTPELFVRPGKRAEVRRIRECLDTGAPFTAPPPLRDDPEPQQQPAAAEEPQPMSAHSFAAALLQFLEQLGRPVLGAEVHGVLLRSTTTHAECKRVLAERLSDEQYTVFYYLVAFLRELARHSESNGLTPERLAVIFSGVLLRPPPPQQQEQEQQKQRGEKEQEQEEEEDKEDEEEAAEKMKKDADFVIYRFLIE